jgi:hypothetical protein
MESRAMPQLSNSPPDTRIKVTAQQPDDDVHETTGVLGALIDVYRKEGYERGYHRALHDVLDSLVGVTERFLRDGDPDSGASRRLIYAYVEFLEREIHAASNDVAGYVSGGLGI